MLSALRSPVAPLRRALAGPLARRGVDPDRITMAALPLGALAGACLWQGWAMCGTALGVLAFLSDFVDGEIARMQGRSSNFGNYLEACVDRCVEASLLTGLARTHTLAACVAMALSFLVSYLKARVGLVVVTTNDDWPGVGDRTDRCCLLVLAAACSAGHPSWCEAMLWALAAMAASGALSRLAYARRLIREAEAAGTLLPYLRQP